MATKSATATLHAEIPLRLAEQLQALVDAGWWRSVDDLTAEALRRYLESHREELLEKFVREDVEWGLRGGD